MISSLKQILTNNNNHSIKYEHNQLLLNTKIDLEENMSILTNNKSNNYQEKNDDDDDEDDDDETSRLVSIKIENNQGHQSQYEQQASGTTLRSILRKRTEKKMSTDDGSNVQQTSIAIDENVNDDDEERDSDYTGDENEEEGKEEEEDEKAEKEESIGSNKGTAEESKNNEHQHWRNYSRHQQRDQIFRTSHSTPLDFPLETGTPTLSLNENDQSSNRTSCVKFTNDQPIIIHRSSSTPQLGGLEIQPRSSVTYINIREDISTSIPITTTTMTSAPTSLGAEFRPVYISPLKYRPLVGLSANDNRLLLEKRVSLLGKPVVFHPIQKRSPNYRRTQSHVYNFLERPHGYKAVFYHTFV
jgi:hypothetical protein